MFGLGKKKISTESYKGVRDFYPEAQSVQNYIFNTMRDMAESWGYVEYNASVLEPLELYESKSSEEIVKEQIYSFEDRGGRKVALRPEMTPTVSRMVGAKIQELPSPIRWYSIANFFRYEKPQRGREREFWQLNVDLFGVSGFLADAEIVNIAFDVMKKFGSKKEDFEIKINSRQLLEDILKKSGIEGERNQFVYRLLDKKEKMPEADFKHSLGSLVGEEKSKGLLEALYFGEGLLSMMAESEAAKNLNMTIRRLRERGISNIVFNPTLTRGFDYYTGLVFEVFDANKENTRSLFGGGRYDELVGAFTGAKVPACGFGMGDITIRDFLLTHDLMPEIRSTTDLYLCVAPETPIEEVYKLAASFRKENINVGVDISQKKLGDQLKSLDKRKIPFVITVGQDELKNGKFILRNTYTREEKSGSPEELAKIIHA